MDAFAPMDHGGSWGSAGGHGELGFADQHRSEFVHETTAVTRGGVKVLFDGKHSVFEGEATGRP